MASLIGGFGHEGTAVGAAHALTLPIAKQSALAELALMRRFMGVWQGQTLQRWAAGPPSQGEAAIQAKRQALKERPFTAFTTQEMLTFQPSLDDFEAQYPAFLAKHQPERGQLLQAGS